MPNPEPRNPERDPAEIYGQMKALEPKYQDLKPATPHGPRLLKLTIYNSTISPELSVTQEIKFSDLGSASQARAIADTVYELNARLSAALNAPTIPRGPINFCSHCGHPVEACPQGFYCQHCGAIWTP